MARTSPASGPNMHAGQGVKQTKNVQEPQHDGYDHDAIQNGLDGRLHGNKAIDQPQENADHDQNFEKLNQRHFRLPFLRAAIFPRPHCERL